ncbi:hypothetical protein NIE88_09760 [Sporolactobacillus shoreicorticis]|uniref:Primase C-terminal 1 domain-containing protein n=1 Tax=Sporolactobacillus shoreicorticis TaxID=1923877 RepID=A0ABW5SA29_9BACL|nr:hypothetical protein [Sporolactobacillus shoreicorticis]MCO7126061.1 hypothetical protein [Sporolactobacillus shoreicorticis]
MKTNKGTVSGYFSRLEDLAESSLRFEHGAPGVYFTLNPVKKALLARAENRTMLRMPNLTADSDIESRRWLPLDFDPVRPSGISSTDKEHEAALTLAQEVKGHLSACGFPEPVSADSGNGAHLLYRIQLPNDDASRQLIKRVLEVIADRFSTKTVHIDKTVYNAARIWKLYGTLARKGDNTKERSYRHSKILAVPTSIDVVPESTLRRITGSIPEATSVSNSLRKSAKRHVKVDEWLAQHEIEVAKTKSQPDGSTIYVLKSCPWNPEHSDKTAYVIQFSNGAIAAGCQHASCADANWKSLREKYKPLSGEESKTSDSLEKMSQADELMMIGSVATYYYDQETETTYASFEKQGHFETWKLNEKQFKGWLRNQYRRRFGKTVRTEAIKQALSSIEAEAMYDEKATHTRSYFRVAKVNDSFFYDLANTQWTNIKVSAAGCSFNLAHPPIFYRVNALKEQPDPDFSGDVKLLLKHIHLKAESDQMLLLSYLITCFIPDIPHVALVLSGEKGAAKSTTLRMLKRVVDPSKNDLLVMPKSRDDMAVTLTQNYMVCFDNLETLTKEQSNLLCMASTGGGFTKRKLYTDSDDIVLNVKRCVALNGINIAVTESDLLDRSLLIDLDRIDEKERVEERVIWERFDADLPMILGGALNTLSRAMPVYSTLKLNSLPRMADFAKWGYAIAEVLGYGGPAFIEAYKSNQQYANEEALNEHPVATAIKALMAQQPKWSGTVTELLIKLQSIAFREHIDTHLKTWPSAPNALSRRLNEVKSNFKEIGIEFVIRHTGQAKKITIEKKNSVNTVNTVDPNIETIDQTDGTDDIIPF